MGGWAGRWMGGWAGRWMGGWMGGWVGRFDRRGMETGSAWERGKQRKVRNG